MARFGIHVSFNITFHTLAKWLVERSFRRAEKRLKQRSGGVDLSTELAGRGGRRLC